MKKKFIGCFSIAVAVLVIGCFVYQFHATPKKAKADTVPSLVEEMKNIIDKKIKDDPVLQASSNPNDYIKDNTAYDKLIQMGVKRVPEMLTYLESSDGSGLENYLTALAVEDIMDCNLKETEYAWEDSKDFVTQFSDMVKDRKKIVKNAMEKAKNVDEVEKVLQPYGLVATETALEMQNTDSSNNKYEKYVKAIQKKSTLKKSERSYLQKEILN
ncbi:putative uncharacterized protein [Clostridium sp. CAG:230]|jgi:hypothetical protein|nr:putative uncharacterized protein [Clostridium sp. CAG:230]